MVVPEFRWPITPLTLASTSLLAASSERCDEVMTVTWHGWSTNYGVALPVWEPRRLRLTDPTSASLMKWKVVSGDLEDGPMSRTRKKRAGGAGVT